MKVKHFISMLSYFVFMECLWFYGFMMPKYQVVLDRQLAPQDWHGAIWLIVAFVALFCGHYCLVLRDLCDKTLHQTLLNSAILGCCVYGTYAVLSVTLVAPWTLTLSAWELSWGIFLFVSTAFLSLILKLYD